MKTSVEAVSGVERRIRVEIPAEEVSRRMERSYAEVRSAVPIRGFRKGKAPMAMVKRLFKESVEADLAEELVRESLTEAVKQSNLKVLAMNRIDDARLAEGENFAFTATVEVVPDVEPVEYKGLPVVKEKVEVTDEQVATALEGLRESFAHYHAVEGRGAAPPDLVEAVYSASLEGEAIERDRSASFLLGTGVPLGKDFEERLAGAVPGETRRFESPYPPEFPDPKVAGKTASFEVTVNAVREKALPPLDDEFAKTFKDVAGLDDLKEKMRDRLRREAEERSRLRVEEEIRRGLLERNVFEVPGTLVDRQIAAMIKDMASRMASQGVDLKKVSMDFDKMRERFAPAAERSVRVSLLLEGIAEKENIDVSFSEIESEMKAIAAASEVDYEKVRQIYGEEEQMDRLRNRLLERKIMDFLIAGASAGEEGGTE
jgi:trigger factor